MNIKEAKRKRREHRQAIARDRMLADRSSKENLINAVKAYHIKCLEYHKCLQDAREMIADPTDDPEVLAAILADIDKVLTPAPRAIPADSIPAQVQLQQTLDEMRARGEFPEGTAGKAM